MKRKRRIARRELSDPMPDFLQNHHPVLRRVLCARAVRSQNELDHSLKRLLSPDRLLDIERAAALLDEAIDAGRRIVVVGDYDADGATGCALAVRALRRLGAEDVRFEVPDRLRHGYGLSAGIVDRVHRCHAPDLIVTVDNGISSIEGAARARAHGIDLLITDHHLPGDRLPEAQAIVNPNRSGDPFPSKHLAGVGVIFYVMCALRTHRRRRNREPAPRMDGLLDLVALGTVADLVPLDHNNRILVEQGLKRIRKGRGSSAGIRALLEAGKRSIEHASTSDLGFAVGPRLNAAGRLEDMRIGIECLLSDDENEARRMAARLDAINRQRRELDARMQEDALEDLLALYGDAPVPEAAISLFKDDWHSGLIGILASRLKERIHRPVAAFAPDADPDSLRGSVRSIPGVHVRDLLADVSVRNPGLIMRFGGHAMAAGLTIVRSGLERFRSEFADHASQVMTPGMREAVVDSDGEIAAADLGLDLARKIRDIAPWGQKFPEPIFDGIFKMTDQRPVGAGSRHRRLRLLPPGSDRALDAIAFNRPAPIPTDPQGMIRIAYRLAVNRFRGLERAELTVEEIEEVPAS
ncbi:single-stranded-DNA-specific exonuclease RecJ [Thioalkalivibrio sp. HK1]|uniref:single-stranded-DNA-specific exonuclease RecJ n=1 Tax=Thioalkalivibrio sp. HK1 TaxID=1469245 RepID=UPI0004721D44|nr:single-stranded-DNA-specific exonuclease RecJ [Thioalkalivibrio sp. HK1]